ncbi:46 kDa FK506-binding nuclear protein-like [Leptopilina heterotoma]|uniref:46 kDa FK506-binding nuclear protein-like n=1 Tax=Leptopilina heterotoma TaxID=63436 RepID=UPI001CA899D1|nr:46 kDa FK506-binding nuclear protein-like [Leptopilina heterotoma]
MFWGLIMEPNKRYSQVVERSFHLSMASLDVTSANDQPVQVMLCYENRNYLLCTLKKGSHYQVPLDLNFQENTKIAFTCNGFGHVHLTGYLTLDDEDFDFGDLEEEEDEDEEEEVPQLVKNKRKAATESPQNNKKKIKKQVEAEDDESSDDDDDDDDMEAESDSEIEDSKLMGEDEVDSDESDDDDDDEEDDDSDDDESEQEVEKPKQQKQKQNQNQVNKKQEKQKMVNGKDTKVDGKQKKNKTEQNAQQQQQQQQQQQKRKTIEGGVQIEDLKVGNGSPAKPGRNVSVYYVGRLKNGKKFDETKGGEGFKFKLGGGDVIKGWDVGISGMKVGGKRRLTIPPAMGYGHKGSPPVIPGNSTLVFEVELKNVH